MKLFPESAYLQLEFDKIKALLNEHCQTEYAQSKASQLRIHTRKEYIDIELKQTYEYRQLIQHSTYFPNDYILNLSKELKLLAIPGAVLGGDQLMEIRKLAESIQKIFRWFDHEKKSAYSSLAEVIKDTYYEKAIIEMIDAVLDGQGQVKDNASDALRAIRQNLYRKRSELRRLFE